MKANILLGTAFFEVRKRKMKNEGVERNTNCVSTKHITFNFQLSIQNIVVSV